MKLVSTILVETGYDHQRQMQRQQLDPERQMRLTQTRSNLYIRIIN